MQTVLHVCVHNAGRSQMVEAYANMLAEERGLAVLTSSAGAVAGQEINPAARAVTQEMGVSMAVRTPKQLMQAMADGADRLITMGRGVDAEACPTRIHLSQGWDMDDPNRQPLEKVRAVRDEVKRRVETLLLELGGKR